MLLRVCTSVGAKIGSESNWRIARGEAVKWKESLCVSNLKAEEKREEHRGVRDIEGEETYRNKALASPKPSAKAKTASLDAAPKSLKANIARYRSNRGDFVFNNAVRNSGIDWGRDEGAGSIVGKSGLAVSSTLTSFLPCRGLAPCSPTAILTNTT